MSVATTSVNVLSKVYAGRSPNCDDLSRGQTSIWSVGPRANLSLFRPTCYLQAITCCSSPPVEPLKNVTLGVAVAPSIPSLVLLLQPFNLPLGSVELWLGD